MATKTAADNAAAKQAYWDWQKYVVNEWQPPAGKQGEKQDKLKLVGFAITLASFGKSGKNIHPGANALAERAGMATSGRAIKGKDGLRQRVINLGLFRPTGGNAGRVKTLEIAYPDDNSAAVPAKVTPVAAPVARNAKGQFDGQAPVRPAPSTATVRQSFYLEDPRTCEHRGGEIIYRACAECMRADAVMVKAAYVKASRTPLSTGPIEPWTKAA